MDDRRRKDRDWYVSDETGNLYVAGCDGKTLATLMDIRDELRALNRLLNCSNFLGIPTTLRSILRNTAKPRKRRKT